MPIKSRLGQSKNSEFVELCNAIKVYLQKLDNVIRFQDGGMIDGEMSDDKEMRREFIVCHKGESVINKSHSKTTIERLNEIING